MKCNKHDIDVIEGTTHLVRFTCSSDGEPFNFTDYKALLVIIDGKEIRRKKTSVNDNVITAKIDPSDTIGKNVLSYECRAFFKCWRCVSYLFRRYQCHQGKSAYYKI